MGFSFWELLFPRKCIFCNVLLEPEQYHLCPKCQTEAPDFHQSKKRISFLEEWTALWYYKDNVRESILRYKFGQAHGSSRSYAVLLARRLRERDMAHAQLMTWVPISAARKRKRGFDQVELIARDMSKKLGIPVLPLLKKIRDNPAQSSLANAAQRKANVLGAYEAVHQDALQGKHILLLDDVITTGSTISECARVLLTAGAKSVTGAAVAAVNDNTKR